MMRSKSVGMAEGCPRSIGNDTEEKAGNSEKQQAEVGVGAGAGGGEVADVGEGVLVFAAAAGGFALFGREQGGAEVGDEQGGLGVRCEAFESGHEFGAGEERGGRGEGAQGVPMKEAVAGLAGEKLFEEAGGGGGEGGVVAGGKLGVFAGLLLKLGEAEGDGFLNLAREVKVVSGETGEEGVDEVEATQVVAGGGGHRTRVVAGGLRRSFRVCGRGL